MRKVVLIGTITALAVVSGILTINSIIKSAGDDSQGIENRNFSAISPPPEVVTWLGEKRIFFFATDVNWGENWEEIEVAQIMVENNRNVRLLLENRPFRTFAYLQNEVWGRNSNRFRLSVNGRSLLTPPDKPFLDASVERFVHRENVKMRIRLVGSRVRHPDPSEIYYEKTFPQELENVKVENWDSLDAFIMQTDPPSLSTAREYTTTIKNYRDEPVKVELHVGLYGKFQGGKQWWFDHSFGHYHEENQVILRPGERRTVTFTLIPDSRHSYHFDSSSDVRAKIKVTGVGCESGKAGTIAKRSRILVEGKD